MADEMKQEAGSAGAFPEATSISRGWALVLFGKGGFVGCSADEDFDFPGAVLTSLPTCPDSINSIPKTANSAQNFSPK